jgi:hypothetical protein
MVGTSWVTPAYSAVGNMATLPRPADPTPIVGNPDDIASDCEKRASVIRFPELKRLGQDRNKGSSLDRSILRGRRSGNRAVGITDSWPKKKTPKQTPGAVVNAVEQDPESVQNLLLESPLVNR